MISLTRFCKENDLSKTSTWELCRELGIPTSEGLNDEAVAKLKDALGIKDKPAAPTDDEPVKPGSIILHQGRSLPSLPGQFQAPDLEIDLGDFYDLQDRGAKLADASAQQLGSFLSRYAAHRVQQSIARIDAEISAIEGQALNQAVGKLAG